MSLSETSNDYWKAILHNNKLSGFENLWSLKAEWFEEPNIRRGGWSGVVKHTLSHSNNTIDVFIKRQENHISKTLLHPIKGIATFQKEFNNIIQLTKHQVPTLELVYFGQRDKQAILVTKSLEGYHPLDSEHFYALGKHDKKALLFKIATASAAMHQCRFQHNCLYPKHIFAAQIDKQWDIKFIDLEKLKRTPLRKQATERDLLTLYRHADEHWTLKDRIHFFRCYTGEDKLTQKSKQLWRKIEKKLHAKRK